MKKQEYTPVGTRKITKGFALFPKRIGVNKLNFDWRHIISHYADNGIDSGKWIWMKRYTQTLVWLNVTIPYSTCNNTIEKWVVIKREIASRPIPKHSSGDEIFPNIKRRTIDEIDKLIVKK